MTAGRAGTLAALVLFGSGAAATAAPRVLTQTIPASGLERVALHAGVGDVRVQAGGDDAVVVEVALEPRRGGLFSSLRQAEREVQEASLEVESEAGELRLRVETRSEERRFEERWTVVVPARLAFALEAGVGDVELRGLSGGLTLEVGVGDVLVEAAGGDLDLELGVGNLTLRAPADDYAKATCSCGVGNARLRVRGSSVERGGGFVGSSSSWTGSGSHRLEAESGVGDVTVTLD